MLDQQRRVEIVAKYPNITVTEVYQKLTEMWNDLSPEEKHAYHGDGGR
jgi:hypothetical protein